MAKIKQKRIKPSAKIFFRMMREEWGLTIDEIAPLTGLSTFFISELERGKKKKALPKYADRVHEVLTVDSLDDLKAKQFGPLRNSKPHGSKKRSKGYSVERKESLSRAVLNAARKSKETATNEAPKLFDEEVTNKVNQTIGATIDPNKLDVNEQVIRIVIDINVNTNGN